MSGFLPRDKVFEEERVTSNNFEFRKITFEQVIMDYQIKRGDLSREEFERRISTLYSIIDQVTEDIENWEPIYQYAYYQMDLRRYTINQEQEPVEKNGRKYLELKPQMPEKLTELREMKRRREKRFINIDIQNFMCGLMHVIRSEQRLTEVIRNMRKSLRQHIQR